MTQQRPTALVTGASRGIGRGIALALGREGYNVVINYASNAAAAEEVKRLIEAAGPHPADPHPSPLPEYRGREESPHPNPLPAGGGGGSPASRREGEDAGPHGLAVQADISIAADRQRLVDQAIAAFGRIDLLVNNAGVAPKVRADMLEATEESFDQMIAINLKGPYFLTQLVAGKMIEQVAQNIRDAGKIITITSISVYTASTNRGDYCLAKAGLAMMTKLYAARLAEHGINVYEIRPGIIETDMTGPVKAKYDKLILEDGLTPIRRWGQPEDVARAVIAIAKNLVPFSTGEVINVDGGFHLQRL